MRKGQYEKYMTVVQSYWKKIGVTMNLSVEDNGVWSSDWADGNLEVTALGWYPLFADADNHMYTYFYSENAAKKSSFYNSAEVDDLLSRARVSQDPDERAELYTQADHIITHEDYAAIPLYWPKSSFVSKPYVLTAAKKQRLADAAGPALLADEAGRKDARLVRDDQVSRLEIVDDVGKHLMLDVAVLAVEDKQTAGVARLRGSLGDELVWKGVIEIVGAHSLLPFLVSSRGTV